MRLAVCGEGCTPCEAAGTGASALLCLQAARRLVETGISHVNHSRGRVVNAIEFSFQSPVATAAALVVNLPLRRSQKPLINIVAPCAMCPSRSAARAVLFLSSMQHILGTQRQRPAACEMRDRERRAAAPSRDLDLSRPLRLYGYSPRVHV